MNKYDKKKYEKDFPDQGFLNWKTVILKTPDNSYYDGLKINGVFLHDGNLMINGVLFLANQFEIIDEDPLKLIELKSLQLENDRLKKQIEELEKIKL